MNSFKNNFHKLTKKRTVLDIMTKEHQNRVLLAVMIGIFGIIVFIALALTLPLNNR